MTGPWAGARRFATRAGFTLPRWVTRLTGTLIAVATLVGFAPRPASACGITSPCQVTIGAGAPVAPPVLGFINLTDTGGDGIWMFQLHIDHGGVSNPSAFIWSFLDDLFWTIYLSAAALVIWFIRWVLSFQWLTVVSTPAMSLGNSLHSVVAQFGATTAFLTITAFVGGTYWLRGKVAGGVVEIFTSLVIAALALGAFANPVQKVAGPNGYIVQARNFGLGIASGMANNGNTIGSPDQQLNAVSESMVDTFVRMPYQLMNYGKIEDGTKCESAFNQVVADPKPGLTTLWFQGNYKTNAIGKCDPAAKDYAGHPSVGQATSGALLGPAVILLLLFALVLAGAIILATVSTVYNALKSIWSVVWALLPGAARGSLWILIASTITSLILIGFTVVFLMGYMLGLQAVFADKSNNPMVKFVLLDALMIAGVIIYWRAKDAIHRAHERMAKMLASRPGLGPSELPRRSNNTSQKIVAAAALAGPAGAVAGFAARGALGAGRVGIGAGRLGAGGAGRATAGARGLGSRAVGRLNSMSRSGNTSHVPFNGSPGAGSTTPLPDLGGPLGPTGPGGGIGSLSAPLAAAAPALLGASAAAQAMTSARVARRSAVEDRLGLSRYRPVRAANGQEVLVTRVIDPDTSTRPIPSRPTAARAIAGPTRPLPSRGRVPAIRRAPLALPAPTRPRRQTAEVVVPAGD